MLDEPAAEGDPPDESVEYIERMTRELSRLATASELPFLAYILDMATEEASRSRTRPGFDRPTPRMTEPDAGVRRVRNEI